MAKKFTPPIGVERKYASSLRKIAGIVGDIVDSFSVNGVIVSPGRMQEALRAYSSALGPWAERAAGIMIKGVAKKNRADFIVSSKAIGAELRALMAESSIGATAKAIQDRQVTLIKSLPIEAGERAQKIAQEAAITGGRAREAADRILETESVTKARATLIARTEISKANAALTQARAQAIGVNSYIWRTAGDGDVRESHAEMDGEIFRFDSPPTLSDGETGNPGDFPNCRCYAEPLILDGASV